MRLAVAAGIAGLVAGYASRRSSSRRRAFAVLQGLDWFLAAGGAALLTDLVRRLIDDEPEVFEVTERMTDVREAIFDRDSDR